MALALFITLAPAWIGQDEYLRGVAVAGGSFGDGTHTSGEMTTAQPGDYGVDWFYEVDGGQRTSDSGLSYLEGRGVDLIRVDFRWERLQPQLGGPFNDAEVRRITAMLDAAERLGLQVILDCHNYGHYKTPDSPGLSSPQGGWPIGHEAVSYESFADLWRRIAIQWGDHPAVWGWELMNEPVAMDGPGKTSGVARWQAASQAAVDAIRAVKPAEGQKAVLVAGYEWSKVGEWDVNGVPWITDSLGDRDRLVYVGHHYWDADQDSNYGEDTPAGISGSVEAHVDVVVAELREFTSWLTEHGVRGAVTEVGWPADDTGGWNSVAEAWFTEADAFDLHVIVWATGSAWGDYELAVYEANPGSWSWPDGDTIDTANVQASVLEAHPSKP